ncbi:hypothetical protein QLX08_008067 [Tetragonisca angustula]|uniref:Uncharacterized protein n=1 Tax=Tetragonisca angustula TaxID=166442 RepID=A0AAW0ZMC8_9HYME
MRDEPVATRETAMNLRAAALNIPANDNRRNIGPSNLSRDHKPAGATGLWEICMISVQRRAAEKPGLRTSYTRRGA